MYYTWVSLIPPMRDPQMLNLLNKKIMYRGAVINPQGPEPFTKRKDQWGGGYNSPPPHHYLNS